MAPSWVQKWFWQFTHVCREAKTRDVTLVFGPGPAWQAHAPEHRNPNPSRRGPIYMSMRGSLILHSLQTQQFSKPTPPGLHSWLRRRRGCRNATAANTRHSRRMHIELPSEQRGQLVTEDQPPNLPCPAGPHAGLHHRSQNNRCHRLAGRTSIPPEAELRQSSHPASRAEILHGSRLHNQALRAKHEPYKPDARNSAHLQNGEVKKRVGLTRTGAPAARCLSRSLQCRPLQSRAALQACESERRDKSICRFGCAVAGAHRTTERNG